MMNLKRIRMDAEIPDRLLAHEAGVTRAKVYSWERSDNPTTPRVEHARAVDIAAILLTGFMFVAPFRYG